MYRFSKATIYSTPWVMAANGFWNDVIEKHRNRDLIVNLAAEEIRHPEFPGLFYNVELAKQIVSHFGLDKLPYERREVLMGRTVNGNPMPYDWFGVLAAHQIVCMAREEKGIPVSQEEWDYGVTHTQW